MIALKLTTLATLFAISALALPAVRARVDRR